MLVVDQLCRELLRQPRLSATAGTNEADELGLGLEQFQLADVLHAAHERGRLDRYVGPLVGQRAQRRKVHSALKIDKLKDVLWPFEVFQAVEAQIPQIGAGR